LIDYLLDTAHEEGGPKATLLRYFGYSEDTVELLEAQLLAIVRGGEVISSRPTQGGTNYVVPGELATPSGRPLPVQTVWFVGGGDDPPRFVTLRFP
jgi:hypothetical protein